MTKILLRVRKIGNDYRKRNKLIAFARGLDSITTLAAYLNINFVISQDFSNKCIFLALKCDIMTPSKLQSIKKLFSDF